MAGIKRHTEAVELRGQKKTKLDSRGTKRLALEHAGQSDSDKFGSDSNSNLGDPEDFEEFVDEVTEKVKTKTKTSPYKVALNPANGSTAPNNGNTSRESHAKQRVLAQERKAAKPNADSIARSKKIWERLRRKSHVPAEERKELVIELFAIITGRVKEFVFKHDSVRVIQCAVKYSTPEQKRLIARELRGEYQALAESKYAKFLIAKLVVGDNEIRDIVVPEFYGHVKRLIRHPEASWIMDDIYRTIATGEQKAMMLREWYGPEFVIFKGAKGSKPTAELSEILKESPEKKGPIMQHLKELTNQLVQKKTTGYTMLHDALLHYFLNCNPGSSEAAEFLEMLKDDEEGDCYKNLAFTKSGSRLVCLALAHGNSKDRRTILKFFKTHIKLLAGDAYGHLVLLAAYDLIDDTVMSSKAIFPELLCKNMESDTRNQELFAMAENLTARIPLLYLMGLEQPKWLLPEIDNQILNEIHEIRRTTSKKDAETRRIELATAISQPLLDLVADQAGELIRSGFGCQFVNEIIFGAIGEKRAALQAVAALASSRSDIDTPYAGRMLKALVQGGRFDKKSNSILPMEPRLDFGDMLYAQISSAGPTTITDWAVGGNSFVVLAMLESTNFEHMGELQQILAESKIRLLKTAKNAGTKIILDKVEGYTKHGKT